MTGSLQLAVGLGVAVLVGTVLVLRPLIGWLRRRALMDVPNHRSSHRVPTPRGGGIAVTALMVAGWAAALAWTGTLDRFTAVLLLGTLALGALSWLDDLRDLPRRLRLAGHAAAAVTAVVALPADLSVSQGLLAPWVERPLLVLAWIWAINLYNFMDGIDGISGAETIHLGVGVAVVAVAAGLASPWPLPALGAVAAGAALGFLVWNWHPAKVFLGDVGSVPLGFLLAGLLVMLAGAGAWAAALILPAYYVADATVTLVRRVARGHSPVEAHREHAYQRAVAGGLTHGGVVWRIVAGNLALLGAALLATWLSPLAGLGAAVAVVCGLMWSLTRRPLTRRAASDEEAQTS